MPVAILEWVLKVCRHYGLWLSLQENKRDTFPTHWTYLPVHNEVDLFAPPVQF